MDHPPAAFQPQHDLVTGIGDLEQSRDFLAQGRCG
jgi:hypothetical protein